MPVAFLSLGSNIDAERHLSAAVLQIGQQFEGVAVSPVYRTPAVGFEGDAFLNAAVKITTVMPPLALNQWLRATEDAHGRRRDIPRFSSRTLDLDLVLYDDLVIATPELQLPRPELLQQAFVLRPMADIAPQLVHPVAGRRLDDLWRAMWVAGGWSGERVTLGFN